MIMTGSLATRIGRPMSWFLFSSLAFSYTVTELQLTINMGIVVAF